MVRPRSAGSLRRHGRSSEEMVHPDRVISGVSSRWVRPDTAPPGVRRGPGRRSSGARSPGNGADRRADTGAFVYYVQASTSSGSTDVSRTRSAPGWARTQRRNPTLGGRLGPMGGTSPAELCVDGGLTAFALMVLGLLATPPEFDDIRTAVLICILGVLHTEIARDVERSPPDHGEELHVDLGSVWLFDGRGPAAARPPPPSRSSCIRGRSAVPGRVGAAWHHRDRRSQRHDDDLGFAASGSEVCLLFGRAGSISARALLVLGSACSSS